MHNVKKTSRIYLDKRLWDTYELEVNRLMIRIEKMEHENRVLKKYISKLQSIHGIKSVNEIEEEQLIQQIQKDRAGSP